MAMHSARPDAIHSSGDLIDILRLCFLQGVTGRVRWDGDKRHALYLRDGRILIDRDGEWAEKLAPAIRRAAELDRPWTDPEVVKASEWLGHRLGEEAEASTSARVEEDSPGGVELLGPLPLIGVLMEASVHKCDQQELIDRLGGERTRLSTSSETPAMGQLQGMDPEMAKIFAQLENPATLAELLRGMGTSRLAALRGLVKLWSIGLVVAEHPQAKEEEGAELASPKMMERFHERIAGHLEDHPVELSSEAHRQELARLYQNLDETNHYELLDVGLKATDEEIFRAFQAYASKVHPSHTQRLDLKGKGELLRLLFERGVEAYLTLSDPRRRASYNTLQGLRDEVSVDRTTRSKEKEDLARQNYRSALRALGQMDFSTAVDLLKEAVRMDPQLDYYKALASAQAKNPNWRRHAIQSFRSAIELAPDDAGLHLGLARVLEEEDHLDEAREAYQRCLEIMPDNPKAQSGLQRLGGRPTSAGGLRSALGRK